MDKAVHIYGGEFEKKRRPRIYLKVRSEIKKKMTKSKPLNENFADYKCYKLIKSHRRNEIVWATGCTAL